LQLNTRKASK